ncbi:sensor histidine kinase [Coralliovum pocilloporae]|uniref:sensor histidine kinase n=1 Tax=Coralliovum pocilloporae TaxID=3066369 RepID=UPI003306D102
MELRAKLTVCIASLTGIVIFCTSLLVWHTYSTSYNDKRTDLAYRELAGYLQLSSQTFRAFKQIRRDLMFDEREISFDLNKLEKSIFYTVGQIETEATAEAEVGLREDEDDDDVERIDILSQELKAAFTDVRTALAMIASGQEAEGREFLSTSLKQRVDGTIDKTFQSAIADEKNEVATALAEIEQINRIEFWVAIGAATLAFLFAGIALYVIAYPVSIGFSHLKNGARLFASGRLDHRIPITGNDELATLSKRYNTMAQQLQDQRAELEYARASLEHRVTERTEQLRIANDRLKRRDSMRTLLFADIGHELRTPITAVRGEAEVALRTRKNQRDAYRAALERIIAATDQLTRFINDIFLIARQEAGVLDMRQSRLNLKIPIRSAIEQTHACAVENMAAIYTNLPECEAQIKGDAQRICQFIQILIGNSIHHSPDPVNITVSLQQEKGNWLLSVEDDGPGISAEQTDQVFERYYRGPTQGEGKSAHGTGLGLPIAKSIVEAHGGRIWISKRQTTGMRVTAAFPAFTADPAHARHAKHEEEAA